MREWERGLLSRVASTGLIDVSIFMWINRSVHRSHSGNYGRVLVHRGGCIYQTRGGCIYARARASFHVDRRHIAKPGTA